MAEEIDFLNIMKTSQLIYILADLKSGSRHYHISTRALLMLSPRALSHFYESPLSSYAKP